MLVAKGMALDSNCSMLKKIGFPHRQIHTYIQLPKLRGRVLGCVAHVDRGTCPLTINV